MTYFNNAKRLHKPVSLSLDLEAYEGRLWSVLQADSQDKLTHEEVQSLAETWGMIAAGGFIREMQETRILVPDGELMVFLGNEGLDYFVCPEEVLKGTAHTLKPALDVAIYSEAYFPERSYQGAKLRLPAEPAFLKDAKMRAFIHENEPYRIELLGNWPSFLKNILEKAASVTLEEVNVLACLVSVTELNAMVEAVNEEAVTPQEKLGNSVYRFDREAQRLEKAVEQAEKLDFEPGMSPVFS